MKKQILLYGWLILLIGFFSACSGRLYTSLDVLRPASITFPKSADKILIVNNSAIQPYDYGHKSELLNQKPKNIRMVTDSLPIFCVSALADELSEKYFFKSVSLLQNQFIKSASFYTLQSIPSDSIKHLCDKYNVNAILSLDRLKAIDNLTEYYLGNTVNIEKPYVSTLEVRYETIWTIQYPSADQPSNTFVLKDTLSWENEAEEKQYIQTGLPDRYNSLVDGALYAGRNTVNRLVPYWEKVDRYFFESHSSKIKQSLDSVYVKNWDAAISILEKVISISNSKIVKAKAANNLAVCYEIKNDIDSALKYAMLSKSLLFNTSFFDYDSFVLVSGYVDQLMKRKEEIETLKSQLGE